MSPDLGTIQVNVESEGADEAAEDVQQAQEEQGQQAQQGRQDQGLMDQVTGMFGGNGGDGGGQAGGDGGGIMGALTGILGAVVAVAGILLSMKPIQKMLSAFMKVIQAFFIPVASMLMSLLAPALKYMLSFLPGWIRWTQKEPAEQAESLLETFLEGFKVPPACPGVEEEPVELDWLFSEKNWRKLWSRLWKGGEGKKPGEEWYEEQTGQDYPWWADPDVSGLVDGIESGLEYLGILDEEQSGGIIPETGPYILHQGEAVFNEDQLRALRGALRDGGGETNVVMEGDLAELYNIRQMNPNVGV